MTPVAPCAVANALHAVTLLMSRLLVYELENIPLGIEYDVVPPLCPLVGSPMISRARRSISIGDRKHQYLARP